MSLRRSIWSVASAIARATAALTAFLASGRLMVRVATPSATSKITSDMARSSSARRHADRPVEADRLAVHHRVLDDVRGKHREFRGTAEARRMRNRLGQALTRLGRDTREDRRVEGAGRDGVDADLAARQVARGDDGHADDACLRGSIRNLPDLALESRDR